MASTQRDPEDIGDVYVPRCVKKPWGKLNRHFKKRGLSFLSLNIRSLTGKFSEFIAHLNLIKKKFTFILITESWLSSKTDCAFDIEGYKSVSLHRNSMGGGIKLYYEDHINVTVLENLTSNLGPCEKLFVKANVPGVGCIIVGGVYRPPNKSISDFFTVLHQTLSEINSKDAIVMGDFNINTASMNDSSAQNYINVFHQYGYVNEINLPTYISPVTNQELSCLDHFWHNLNFNRKSFVLEPNLSDHYGTCVIFEKNTDNPPKSIRFRDFSETRVENFYSNLNDEVELFRPQTSHADEYASSLVNFLNRLQNKYFPVKTKILSHKRLKSPWITTDILKCIKKKCRWYRLMKSNIITYQSYKRLSKSLRSLLRFAEADFYRRKFDSLGNDMRRNWKVLNKLLNRTKTEISDHFIIDDIRVSDSKQISEAFGSHFLTNPMNIHHSIPNSGYSSQTNVPINSNTMVFNHTTISEISFYIKKLKKNGQLGDISKKFLILCVNEIVPFICRLFNLCIDQGIFPSVFKSAKITPVYKKGARSCISNYRPISVLTNLSKVFETVIYNRLNNYFNEREILSKNQYGYRKGMSTELAILDLVSKLMPAINDQKYAVCVFLDYSSAFDTLCRNRLLNKLHRYGVRGNGYRLLESYFDARNQSVSYNSHLSRRLYQNIGVVQGSKLGPLLYDIYSNDFNFLCDNNECILYADDTCLVFAGKDLIELEQYINGKLQMVQLWCNNNKMSLNVLKSQFMLITNRRVEMYPSLVIGGNEISRVENFKYLGIMMDEKLKYHAQVEYIKSKLSSLCGVSFRLKNHFNLQSANSFYYALVYSVVSYCIVVWGGLLECTHRGDVLDRLYSKAVKNIFSKFYSQSMCTFKAANILKLCDIYKYRTAIIMFRILKLGHFPSIRNSIDLAYPDHNYPTRASHLFNVPFPRVLTIRMNFQYQFINIWNNLPNRIKNIESIGSFKRELKKYFLDGY